MQVCEAQLGISGLLALVDASLSGMEAPRDEAAGKVEEGKVAAGGRLDDLDEVEQAAREAERES
jgi:hypothetical protein